MVVELSDRSVAMNSDACSIGVSLERDDRDRARRRRRACAAALPPAATLPHAGDGDAATITSAKNARRLGWLTSTTTCGLGDVEL